eukprot:1196174-Prorocentrum_minimum.AAC.15
MSYAAGPFVDTLIRSGAHQYLEFKALEGTLIMGDKGLVPVPSSRYTTLPTLFTLIPGDAMFQRIHHAVLNCRSS